jgi:hypothetical protein
VYTDQPQYSLGYGKHTHILPPTTSQHHARHLGQIGDDRQDRVPNAIFTIDRGGQAVACRIASDETAISSPNQPAVDDHHAEQGPALMNKGRGQLQAT